MALTEGKSIPDGSAEFALRDKTQKSDLAKYLPLSGGTMTGNIAPQQLYAKRLNSSITMGIGSSWDDAPSISLYGPTTSSGVINGFQIRAGAATYAFTGYPDGKLTWNSDRVQTWGAVNKTLLFSNTAGLNSGNITLTQAYTNFPALGFLIGSDSSKRLLAYYTVPVWAITYAKNTIGATDFDLCKGRHYWAINLTTSTTTSLVSSTENSRMYAVWGLW